MNQFEGVIVPIAEKHVRHVQSLRLLAFSVTLANKNLSIACLHILWKIEQRFFA